MPQFAKKVYSTLVSCRLLLMLLFARFEHFNKPFCFYSYISMNLSGVMLLSCVNWFAVDWLWRTCRQ